MRWKTHIAGGLLGALIFQLSPAGIAASLSGSILPDIMDQKISSLGVTRKGRQKIFNKIHRGPTHWFGWWLALFLISVSLGTLPYKEILIGLAIGCLTHVLLDMLTTRGIPLTPFSRQHNLSMHFCSTGSWKEYAFLGVLLVVIGGVIYFSHADQMTLREFIKIARRLF